MMVLLGLVAVLGAFATGAWFGRATAPDDWVTRRAARHGRLYMRALMQLILRNRDGTLAQLKEIVSDNVPEVEPYFALGALLRAGGDHERAIAIHQGLLARSLQGPYLVTARYELALDFRAAAMPRRAMKALEDVLAVAPEHREARHALVALHEEADQWEAAAAVSVGQGELSGAERGLVAHRLVQGAAIALGQQAWADAERCLRQALQHAPPDEHFFTVAGELALAQGLGGLAAARLERALLCAPNLTPLLLRKLFAALSMPRMVDDGLVDPLIGTAFTLPGASPEAALTEILARLPATEGGWQVMLMRYRLGLAPAEEVLPSLLAAPNQAAYWMVRAREALRLEAVDEMRVCLERAYGAHGLLGDMLEPEWQCRACGLRADHHVWRCGGCHEWATLGGRGRPPTAPVKRERRKRARSLG